MTPIPQPLEKNFISYFIRNLMICKFGTFFARRLLQHFSSRSSSKDESCSVAGYLHQDLCRVSKGKDKRQEEARGKGEMLKRKANKNLFSPPIVLYKGQGQRQDNLS